MFQANLPHLLSRWFIAPFSRVYHSWGAFSHQSGHCGVPFSAVIFPLCLIWFIYLLRFNFSIIRSCFQNPIRIIQQAVRTVLRKLAAVFSYRAAALRQCFILLKNISAGCRSLKICRSYYFGKE